MANGNTVTATLPGPTTVGNGLIVIGSYYGFNPATAGVSDSRGHTWTRDYLPATTPINHALYSTILTSAGASHAVTFSGGEIIMNITVIEVIGLLASGRFDVGVQTNGSATASPYTTGSTGALAQADEIVIAALGLDSGENHPIVAEPAWVVALDQPDGTGFVGNVVYRLVTATTPLSHTWTTTHPASGYGTIIGSYRTTAIVPTGVVAAVEAPDTSTITGTFTGPPGVTGTVAATEAVDTAAIAGSFAPAGTIIGSVGGVETADTATIAGTFTAGAVVGVIAAVEANDVAFIYDVLPTPTGALVVSVQTIIAPLVVSVSIPTGGVTPTSVTGTVAATEAADTAAVIGGTTPPGAFSATVAATEAADTSTITGTFAGVAGVIGVIAATEAIDAVSIFANFGTGTAVIFDDHFTGAAIDPSKWIVYDRISDQFNNELNCCVPANVRVGASMLLLDAKIEDHICQDSMPGVPDASFPHDMDYTSGHLSMAAPAFLYGTVDVRAKIPAGQGIWPCIWMLGYLWQPSQPYTASIVGSDWPNGGWCELDIAEFMNGERNQVNCNLHSNTPNLGGMQPLPFNASSRFMVYRIVWVAGAITWYVDAEDGVGFRTLLALTGANIPSVPMFVTINMACGGFGGTPVPATFPATMEIDYVRVTR